MIKKSLIKILIGFGVIILLLMCIFLFFSPPHSVKSFGPLNLGNEAPIVSKNVFEYSLLYDLKYKFYIYAMEKNMDYCALGDCGMSGILVNCMGGWLSSENINGGAEEYGLKEEDVYADKSSIIIVADENKKIIGIYPNYRIQNIPYILKNYRGSFDKFDLCYKTQMPQRW
jgi:hypothetical protein